jgi:hypothetical protein
MATEAELLALAPDNTTGEIGAADLRAIISGTWGLTKGTSLVEQIQFDTAIAKPPHSPGRVYWNSDESTLDIHSEFSDVVLQIGQESWIRVRNNSGALIPNGRPVRITGATGQMPTIALDNGQGLISGVATMDIANNSFGMVTTFGLVRDVNTSAFTDGARVYSSATGTLTTSVTGSFAGQVVLAHPSQGSILVGGAAPAHPTGTTAQRPTARPIGFTWFDTTLGLPIWWNGANWINASGAVV